MGAQPIGDKLRRRRIAAGLSQRALAWLAGIHQPNIAAYEAGRRAPAPTTLARIEAVLPSPTLDAVRAKKSAIIGAAERNQVSDVRIFGSVARGEASGTSDVDLLVHPGPNNSLFELAGFMAEVEELLGVGVDVVSDRGTGPKMSHIRGEAVPL